MGASGLFGDRRAMKNPPGEGGLGWERLEPYRHPARKGNLPAL